MEGARAVGDGEIRMRLKLREGRNWVVCGGCGALVTLRSWCDIPIGWTLGIEEDWCPQCSPWSRVQPGVPLVGDWERYERLRLMSGLKPWGGPR